VGEVVNGQIDNDAIHGNPNYVIKLNESPRK
jgi:hypothetical protein